MARFLMSALVCGNPTDKFQSAVDRHMALRLDAYASLARQDLLRRGLLAPGGIAAGGAVRGLHGPPALDSALELG